MPHEVPPLPYDYNALEPHIDEQTMRIHHDKHHAAYVTNLNGALDCGDFPVPGEGEGEGEGEGQPDPICNLVGFFAQAFDAMDTSPHDDVVSQKEFDAYTGMLAGPANYAPVFTAAVPRSPRVAAKNA